MSKIENYILLMRQFVDNEITASQFEKLYLEIFREDSNEWEEQQCYILNSLFLDVDAYCASPELRDDGDLDDAGLYESVKRALHKLS